MNNEKKIGFSVDDKAFISGMQNINKEVENVFNKIKQSSQSQTGSLKDFFQSLREGVSNYEKEISKQIGSEKKYVSDWFSKEVAKGGGYARPGLIEERKQRMSGVDEMQQFPNMLRDIVETFISTEKKRVDQEKQERLTNKTEERTERKKKYEEDKINDKQRERENQLNLRRAADLTNIFTTTVTAPNMYQGGAAALGQLPKLFGGGAMTQAMFGAASALIGKGFQEASGYETALRRNSALYGRKQSDFIGSGLANMMSGYGINLTDYWNTNVDVTRARGGIDKRGQYSNQTTYDILKATKAYDIDKSQFIDLERLSRNDRSGNRNSVDMVQNMYAGMKYGGVEKALVPEYLQTLVQIGKQQLDVTGKLNTSVSTNMVLAISRLDKRFENPEVLGKVVGAMYGGLNKSNVPQVEAMQLNVLSKMRPNASYFQLRKMMEDPFSKENQQYLPKFLESIKARAGGNTELSADMISQVFFGGKNLSISEGIAKGKLNIKDFKGGGEDIQTMAGKGYGTGILEQRTAQMSNIFAENGEKLLIELEKLTAGLVKVNQSVAKVVKEVGAREVDVLKNAQSFGLGRGY